MVPKKIITKKVAILGPQHLIGARLLSKGIDKIIVISMSNIMKIMANIKNRRENGIRALLNESNPHSKTLSWCRSWLYDEWPVNRLTISKIPGITIDVRINLTISIMVIV